MSAIERVEITSREQWLALRHPNVGREPRFYVYVIRDPRPESERCPIYVGKGRRRRAFAHFMNSRQKRNPILVNIINKCAALTLNPPIEIVAYFDVEAEAFAMEVDLIRKYGRRDLGTGTLCNLTNGGDGVSGSLKVAERMRRVIKEPQFLKAIREGIKRRDADPSYIKARTEAQERRNADPAYTEQAAERMRHLQSNPDFHQANIDRARRRMINLWATNPDFVSNVKNGASKKHTDPAFAAARDERGRKRMIALHADPAWGKRQIDRLRKNNSDPEFTAKRLSGLAAYHASRPARGQPRTCKRGHQAIVGDACSGCMRDHQATHRARKKSAAP